MRDRVATRIGVARVYRPENVDIHAIFRLTLNVITQNLTVTLSTTLSKTLTSPTARESTQKDAERRVSHLSAFTAARHFQLVELGKCVWFGGVRRWWWLESKRELFVTACS